jgi:predicted O-methyltransferase YrrM
MHLPWRGIPVGDGGPLISTSLTLNEARALARLAAGRDVLEIGSAYGFSAAVMAAAGARHVTAVDPHAWLGSHEAMVSNLAACGQSGRVTIIRAPSGEVLPDLPPQGFGLAFIDGDHAYEAVMADVKGVLPLLREGGVLACHDMGEDCCCPGVRQALAELFPAGPYELVDTLFVVDT